MSKKPHHRSKSRNSINPKASKHKKTRKSGVPVQQVVEKTVSGLKLSKDESQKEYVQKELELSVQPSADLDHMKQLNIENQQLKAQIKSLQIENEQLFQKGNELQERLMGETIRARKIEDENHLERQQNQILQAEIQKEVNLLKKKNDDKRNLEKKLKYERKEKLAGLAQIGNLESKLQNGNLTIENLLSQKQELETSLQDKKYQIALEWAQGLGDILTKLSALAEKEPEPVLGLKPRAVYETLLTWLENVFGERPKIFPASKEFITASDGKYLVSLDADVEGLETLLGRYDWSHERPFEGKPEGQRQCQFKVMHWGWKVKDTVLVKSKISSWISRQNQVSSGNDHE